MPLAFGTKYICFPLFLLDLTSLQLFHHNLRTAVHCNFFHFNNGRKCCSTVVVVVFFAWMGIFCLAGFGFFYPRKVLQPRWGLGSTINLLHISPSSSSCPGKFTGYTYPQSTNLVLKYILSDVFVMGSNGHI